MSGNFCTYMGYSGISWWSRDFQACSKNWVANSVYIAGGRHAEFTAAMQLASSLHADADAISAAQLTIDERRSQAHKKLQTCGQVH